MESLMESNAQSISSLHSTKRVSEWKMLICDVDIQSPHIRSFCSSLVVCHFFLSLVSFLFTTHQLFISSSPVFSGSFVAAAAAAAWLSLCLKHRRLLHSPFHRCVCMSEHTAAAMHHVLFCVYIYWRRHSIQHCIVSIQWNSDIVSFIFNFQFLFYFHFVVFAPVSHPCVSYAHFACHVCV